MAGRLLVMGMADRVSMANATQVRQADGVVSGLYRPATSSSSQKKWVKNEVVWLKAVMPEAGCRTIVHYFNWRWKSQRQMPVSKPCVTDTCRRHEYLSLTARRKRKHRISRPMPNNCVWGCDLLVRKNRQGQPQLALGILNHASRACCGCISCPTNPYGR